MYADDSQVYITVNPEDSQTTITQTTLKQHLRDVQAFSADNMLSCNPKKTEIVHFHSRFSHPLSYSSIKLSQHYVPISKKARCLGVIFDSHITMSSHVNSSWSSASLALRNIGRVRKYLDQTRTERPVHAFVSSRLDYCNSLLHGLPAKEINKLRRLKNSAGRLVTRTKVREHIRDITLLSYSLYIGYQWSRG